MQRTIKWTLPTALQKLPVHTICVAFDEAPYPSLLRSGDDWYAFSLDQNSSKFQLNVPLSEQHFLVTEGLYAVGHCPNHVDDLYQLAIAASDLLNESDLAYAEARSGVILAE